MARFNPPIPLKVDDLLLDGKNPRIPPEKRTLEGRLQDTRRHEEWLWCLHSCDAERQHKRIHWGAATAADCKEQSSYTRRRHVAEYGYPLFIEETFIKFDEKSNLEFYKFLLLISLDGPMRRARRYKEVDEIFDHVVSAAVKGYFGDGTQALRFGWPVSGGRPTKFEAALEWLADQVGMPRGVSRPNPRSKDGGVDVVAWKPFGDRMTAFLVAYIQCTVQSDWYPKGRDAIDRVWFGHIDTGGWAPTALAIPFVVPKNYEKWDDLRRIVSLIFDRLRLTRLLRNCDATSFGDMAKWSKKELAKFALI